MRGLSLVVASGGHSSPPCAGLSLSRPLVAEHRLLTRRLSNCGSRAQLLRGTWDLPRPGLEPVSPALAGRFSTTAPPGKPGTVHSNYWIETCVYNKITVGLSIKNEWKSKRGGSWIKGWWKTTNVLITSCASRLWTVPFIFLAVFLYCGPIVSWHSACPNKLVLSLPTNSCFLPSFLFLFFLS